MTRIWLILGDTALDEMFLALLCQHFLQADSHSQRCFFHDIDSSLTSEFIHFVSIFVFQSHRMEVDRGEKSGKFVNLCRSKSLEFLEHIYLQTFDNHCVLQ